MYVCMYVCVYLMYMYTWMYMCVCMYMCMILSRARATTESALAASLTFFSGQIDDCVGVSMPLSIHVCIYM